MAVSGAAAGFAGCVGEDPEADGDDTGNGSGNGNENGNGNGNGDSDTDHVDQWFRSHMGEVPTDVQFNPWNPTNQDGHLNSFTHDPLAYYNGVSGEFDAALATDWGLEDDTAYVELREQTWHNGDQVTANDIVTQWRIDEYFGDALWDYISEAEAVEDQRIEMTIEGDANPVVFWDTVLTGTPMGKQEQYEEWLEDLEAAGEDEEDEIVADLQSHREEELVGHSVFAPEEIQERRVRLSVHEGHPNADQINFNGVQLMHNPGNEGNWQSIREGEQDAAAVAMPEEVRATLPDNILRYMWVPFVGFGLCFNYDHEWFSNRKVRQALAYAIDRELAADNASEYWHVETPTGIGGVDRGVPKDNVGDELENFSQYETDEERARELLEGEGFYEEDGTWYTPNDEEFEVNIKVTAGHSDSVRGMETVSSQLQEFGMDASITTEEATTLYGSSQPEGDFDILTWAWTISPHPFTNWEYTWNDSTELNAASRPTEIEVPMPVGDPDGDLETLNVQELVSDLGRATDDDEVQELMTTLAWAYNQELPFIPTWENWGHYFLNDDGWDLPGQDASEAQQMIHFLLKKGHVQAE
ncbi:ABC transporter substrate-binding protein [Halomontanus rarus]|uniref:ABC transporter substrate-binding protein n=1 Tax=Halomontanus rarus TaxID=3034020 RepID=UPI00293BB4C9|nr:ABC transporter substrate-binding protein [Halovivax sp. KZCA124]